MGTKLFSKMAVYIKVKELKSVLLCHAFYSVEEFVSLKVIMSNDSFSF
jgi:hypothetical protein